VDGTVVHVVDPTEAFYRAPERSDWKLWYEEATTEANEIFADAQAICDEYGVEVATATATAPDGRIVRSSSTPKPTTSTTSSSAVTVATTTHMSTQAASPKPSFVVRRCSSRSSDSSGVLSGDRVPAGVVRTRTPRIGRRFRERDFGDV